MNLSILQWNVKGFFNNYSEIEILSKKYSPHIFSLQETHIQANITPRTPKKYCGYFHNLDANKRAKQGCALLIQKSIPHKLLSIPSNISNVAIEIKYPSPLTILSIYIPPNQSISSRDLNECLINIQTPVMLTGDFNGWSPLWGSSDTNPRGKIIEDFILANNICILNDGSNTHFSTHKTFSAIDLTICSPQLLPISTWAVIDDLHNSDHFPIITSINSSIPIAKLPPKPPQYNCKHANWIKFQENISNNSINSVPSSNINKEAATIVKIIRSSANSSIPISNQSYKSFKNVPWWSPLLNELRSQKQLAWKTFRKNMTLDNHIDFKKKKAIFTREKKLAKTKSFQEFTETLNPNQNVSTIWQRVKTLTGNYSPFYLKTITSNNITITDPIKISSKFAEHYSTQSLTSNFHPNFISEYNSIQNIIPSIKTNSKALFLESDLTVNEFQICLNAVSGTTPGIDKITYQMIKNSTFEFKQRILSFYNNILNSGIIPQTFKIALIVPIKKPKKSSDNIESFRPISLLPCLSKLLEKLIAKRIMWFATATNAFSPNQVGFKPGSSTTDALLYIDHLISKAFSTKNHISILSIDFQKAFDKIGAHVILNKLKEWKIGPKIFNYVKSFLSNRKIRCRVNNTFSETFSLFNGKPQGSPLSVVLFLVAFEDINKIILKHKNVTHCLYADDLYIICNQKDTNTITNNFSLILKSIDEWAQYSGATIAIEKCKHLHICRKLNCTNINIIYNNNIIENVTYLSILGLIFDNKYTFKNHCKSLKSNLATRLDIIKYLSSMNSFVHTNTLLSITKLIILSKIDYGLAVYGKCSKSHLNTLKSPLHTAIRRSLRAFRTTPIENILAEAGFSTIEARIDFMRCGLLHKVANNSSNILHKELKLLKARKTELSVQSGLTLLLKVANKLDLTSEIPANPKQNLPLWYMDQNLFINTLTFHKKDLTPPHVYRGLYAESVDELRSSEWNFIFTDGSKQDNLASFAVVNEDGTVLSNGLLTEHGGVFEAEAQAILSACQIIKNLNKKHVICTDSRSVFEALRNESKSEPIIKIQQFLMSIQKIVKIMWIPGHAGIAGNEHADQSAKTAISQPVMSFSLLNKKLIAKISRSHYNKIIKNDWTRYNHFYKQFNEHKIKINLPSTSSVLSNKIFTRLRLGHTSITHQHLFTKEPPPICQFCNYQQLTVSHLLSCPSLTNLITIVFTNNTPFDVLRIASTDNINLINIFLKKLNLTNNI